MVVVGHHYDPKKKYHSKKAHDFHSFGAGVAQRARPGTFRGPLMNMFRLDFL